MAEEKERNFEGTVESLFNGMDSFLTAKTVVGDVINVNGTIIVPLVDVSFGVAAGAWEKTDKNSAAGGMGGAMKPAAVLVISDGIAKMIRVNQPQDAVSKIIDMVPEIIQKIKNKDKKDPLEDPQVKKAVDDVTDSSEKGETDA